MIPYFFQKIFNFNSTVVLYKLGKFPLLETIYKDLNVEFVKRTKKELFSRNIDCEKSVLKYLFQNAKNISFLNLIHRKRETMIYGLLYKFLNRNGFLYFKFDAPYEAAKNWDLFQEKKERYRGILDFLNFQFFKKINKLFFKKVDLISTETETLVHHFKDKYPYLKDKLIHIPNGIDDILIKKNGIKKIPFKEKENIILSVGNLGLKIKSNETLLEAIAKMDNLKNWKVILIGPIINKSFKTYIEDFFIKNPHLKNKIIFTGLINDRKRLFEYYQKSKIFCLTSIYESFGFVLIEAAFFGNYIVSTDFTSSREITLNGTLGTLFKQKDSEQLAKILQDLINNEEILRVNSPKIMENAEKKYAWSKIIKKIYREIYKRRN